MVVRGGYLANHLRGGLLVRDTRKTIRAAIFLGLASVTICLLPSLADACAVCGAAQDEATRKAFVGTTAFMTFLPLGMLFLVIGWYIRRTLRREEEETARES